VRRWTVPQRIELVAGIAASLTGLFGWFYALFAPIYLSSDESRASVAQVSLNPGSATFFIVMLLAIVGLAASTYRRGRRPKAASLATVWTCTIILVVGTILSGFSVGLFFLPSAVLALCTALAASLSGFPGAPDRPG
jgi:hypothetical protein